MPGAHEQLGRGQRAVQRAARSAVSGRSGRGMIHGGVRWKRCRRPTRGWICGTNWIAEAPVPITATRLPSRSWSWSQVRRVEGRRPRSARGPAGRGSTARSAGRSPSTSACAVERRRARSRGASAGRRRPSSRLEQLVAEADVRQDAVALARSRAGSPRSRAAARRCCVQSGLGANENEYRCEGTSQAQPGIAVVAPGAADVVGALEDDEVLDAGLRAGGWPCRGRRSRCRRWPPSRLVEHYSLGEEGTRPGRRVTPPGGFLPSGAQRQTA